MTDERMREALESRVEELVKIACVKEANDAIEARREFNHTNCVRNAVRMTISEAPSPPARRTSTDAEIESTIDVEGIVRGNAPRRFSDDPYTFGLMQRMVIEGAKATLAGLEKEEERSVPSVRSVLAKHGLIDKVPTSGEEIERACRSSEQEGEE